MANELKVMERFTPGLYKDGTPLPVQGKHITTQILSPTGTSAQSSAFNANTNYIHLHSSLDIYYKVGPNPTAVADATSEFLPANTEREVTVDENGTDQIAFITA